MLHLFKNDKKRNNSSLSNRLSIVSDKTSRSNSTAFEGGSQGQSEGSHVEGSGDDGYAE